MLRAGLRSFFTFAPRCQPLRWSPKSLSGSMRTCSHAPAATVTVDEAKQMPRAMKEFPTNVLVMLAAQGDHAARSECVVREIMAVDGLSWGEAQPRYAEIKQEALNGMQLAKLPYRVAIGTAVVGGLSTFPLCFHLDTVSWFNEFYVTADVADAKDTETWLEVGSWSWNWMEPPLGQLSFFLLTLQYARSQMQNIGLKPYTEWLLSRRGKHLAAKFPQYNQRILEDYAHSKFTA